MSYIDTWHTVKDIIIKLNLLFNHQKLYKLS